MNIRQIKTRPEKSTPHRSPAETLLLGLAFASVFFYFACSDFAQYPRQPYARNGVLDLSQWHFAAEGPVALTGEYEFYWQQHLLPERFASPDLPEPSGFIHVPGVWNDFEVDGKKIGGEGFGTYRLKVLLQKPDILAFKFLDMGTAFRVYVNGKNLFSTGDAGTTRETTVPGYFPGVVEFAADTNQLEIIVQVANFHHRRGGAWEKIELGLSPNMHTAREKALLLDAFLCGSIMIIGLYHLGLFIINLNVRSYLYFSLFCLLQALRLAAIGEITLLYLFPYIRWELLVRLEYLSFYWALPLFAMFGHTLYPEDFPVPVLRTMQILSAAFGAIVLLTAPRVFSHTIPWYQIYTTLCGLYGLYLLIVCAARKREGALINLIGFALLFITIVHDILENTRLISANELLPFGIWAFIASYAYLVSFRFTKTFEMISAQKVELEQAIVQHQQVEIKRRQAETALYEQEERFRQIAENIAEVFWLTNSPKDQMIYISPGYEKIWGCTRESLYAAPHKWMEAILPEDRKRVLEAARTKQTSGQYDEVYRIQRPDGAIRWIRDRAFPVRDQAGEVYRIAGIAEDITERKRAEQTLKKYNQEMQTHAATLKRSNDRLQHEIQERKRVEHSLKRSQAGLRKLSARLEHLLEDERTRIARELHDELGQMLATLKMNLSTLENHFPPDQANLFRITQFMSALITSMIQRVGKIAQDLRPPVLNHLTLVQAIAWQVEEFMKTSGVTCQLSLQNIEHLDFPPHITTALFRVLQEVLTNVLRHAEATQVAVALENIGAHVKLKIQDNGKGFTNKEIDDPQSLGIIGMRERINQVKGNIEIRSGMHQGTTIVCTIPLPFAEKPDD